MKLSFTLRRLTAVAAILVAVTFGGVTACSSDGTNPETDEPSTSSSTSSTDGADNSNSDAPNTDGEGTGSGQDVTGNSADTGSKPHGTITAQTVPDNQTYEPVIIESLSPQ